jgi:hypothetical protein
MIEMPKNLIQYSLVLEPFKVTFFAQLSSQASMEAMDKLSLLEYERNFIQL